MPFSDLLAGIICHIILHAVKARGIKREGRLRYISKWWNTEVVDAICKSGILRGHERNCHYLPRYFAQRVLGRPRTLSGPLSVIRQVAIAMSSRQNSNNNSYDSLRDLVLDLVRVCHCSVGHRNMYLDDDWFEFVDV
jgi:hypothetical protein